MTTISSQKQPGILCKLELKQSVETPESVETPKKEEKNELEKNPAGTNQGVTAKKVSLDLNQYAGYYNLTIAKPISTVAEAETNEPQARVLKAPVVGEKLNPDADNVTKVKGGGNRTYDVVDTDNNIVYRVFVNKDMEITLVNENKQATKELKNNTNK